ncbi:MAG TPA: hypothetical protein GXX30_09985 [Firmicutes bacterium]|nr:hypothetical protein [Candidatus Fermentithermobacillaceae bacterium]
MNVVDLIVVILLLLAFMKGFSAGLWRSLFNLAGTIASFLGALFLTGPIVSYVERTYRAVSVLSGWWSDVFALIPGYARPYQPGTLAEFLEIVDATAWLKPFKALIESHLLAVEKMAGPGATWGKMVSLLLAEILLSGVAFMILLTLTRFLWAIVSSTVSLAESVSLGQRLLGGILQTAISFFWLSVLAGSLYPLLGLDFLAGVREAFSHSWMMSILLGTYRSIWPAILARAGFAKKT